MFQNLAPEWGNFINESLGFDLPKAKENLIAAIAQNKLAIANDFVNESFQSTTSENSQGVGVVKLPASPTDLKGFYGQETGTVDNATSLLGMAISVASQTIAFDLFPVVPVYSELILLEYIDFIYTGGRMDAANQKNLPIIIRIEGDLESTSGLVNAGDRRTWATQNMTANDVSGGQYITFEMYQPARYGNAKIVKIVESGSFTTNGSGNLTTNADGVSAKTVMESLIAAGAGSVFVGAENDAIWADSATGLARFAAFSYVSATDETVKGATSGMERGKQGLNREESEKGTRTRIQMKTYNKSVSVMAEQAEVILERRQERQLKSKGLAGMELLRNAAQDAITRGINDTLLQRAFALGTSNHANISRATGVNLHLYMDLATSTQTSFSNFKGHWEGKEGNDLAGTWGQIRNSVISNAAENLASTQDRYVARIMAAAALGSTVSRHGAYDAIVVNPQLLAVIKKSKNFTGVANTIIQSASKALYHAGSVSDLKIYCDPNMGWEDTRTCALRTGKALNGNDAAGLHEGIVFLPHDLAASIEIVPEATYGKKALIESLFAIAEVGIYPERAYLTFGTYTGTQMTLI